MSSTLYHILYVGFFLGLGLCIHLALLLSEINTKVKMTAWQFIKERPYKVFLMISGAVVGYYFIASSIPDPPEIMLIACGWAANDALDKLGSITNQMKINKDNTR